MIFQCGDECVAGLFIVKHPGFSSVFVVPDQPAMKKSTVILSYLCIFSLGVAVAVVSRNETPDDTQSAGISQDARLDGKSVGDRRSSSENRRAANRDRRTGGERISGTKTSPREIFERLHEICESAA